MTSTTTAPSTTSTEPPPETLALTPRQVSLVGVQLETEQLVRFAIEANDAWGTQEAALEGSKRAALYRTTERRFELLVDWAEELHGRVAALVPATPDAEAAAAAVLSGAKATLAGLRLPASEEPTPGLARRQGMVELRAAAHNLERDAAAQAITVADLTPYELGLVMMRLEVAGFAYDAGVINQAWDERRAGYRRTEWELGNLVKQLTGMVERLGALEAPAERRSALVFVERACAQLEVGADDMIDGLRLPQSAETVPGTARKEALRAFLAAATEFDMNAALAHGTLRADWVAFEPAPPPRLGPIDVEPPRLAIAEPAAGVMVADSEITFAGTSEAGAFVEAGGAAVAVDEAGRWSVDVALDVGVNRVRVTALDAAGNETVVAREVRRGYSLRPDGIGPADGGDDPDRVVAHFTRLFGPPSHDDTNYLEEPAMPGGFSAESYFRLARWDRAGLWLVFADGGYFRTDDKPGLISWSTTRSDFVTPEGIHIGSTMADLRAAYGNRLNVVEIEECTPLGAFYVDALPGARSIERLNGQLTGPPFQSDSVVTRLGGGAVSTC